MSDAPLKAPARPQQDVTLEGKCVVVGDAGVGKTSLLTAFCKDELGALTRPNVGVQFFKKSVSVPEEGLTCNLLAWDTAGSERFRSVNTLYYRGAAAGILVFDLTSRSSFESMDYWLRELRSYAEEGLVVVVCGNKADVRSPPRQVSMQAAQEWAEARGCMYLETSAKTGQNVPEVFQGIGEELRVPVLLAAVLLRLRDPQHHHHHPCVCCATPVCSPRSFCTLHVWRCCCVCKRGCDDR
jgi:small GTP-binding protein